MRTFFTIVSFMLPGFLLAQLEIDPIVKTPIQRKHKTARTQSQTPLSLPFWDDFSFSKEIPIDTLWQDSENVRINPDIGLNPPSLNVASFDGLKVNGEGYSFNSGAIGETDVLTSCPIDLSALSVNDDVYLSFFYQFAGNGDRSEETQGDSLILEFFIQPPDTSYWLQVWPEESASLDRSGAFVQDIVQLDNEDFFRPNFQFRIRSFGRQSGIWDNWNVDYVYMNEGRSPNDLFYPDRTLSSRISSPFNTFTAIPKEHFSTTSLTDPVLTVFSLDRLTDDPQPASNRIEIEVLNFVGEDTIRSSSSAEPPSDLLISPFVTSTDVISPPYNDLTFLDDADSIFLDLTIILASGDMDSVTMEIEYVPEIYRPINFRNNDTTRSRYMISDYYAYDDGTAEFGVGFKQSANQVAYQFELPDGIQDSLTAIDMYFPFLNTDPQGKSIDIVVWADNSGMPGNRLAQQRFSIIRGNTIDEYQRYALRDPVFISGRFYVGYIQNFDGDLRIGLDRNTNSTNRIFENTGGFWEQDRDIETGSLMIRPVFGEPDTSTITSLDPPDMLQTLRYYPNPTTGKLYFNTRIENIQIFDIQAREINFEKTLMDQATEINLLNVPDGIYFMRVMINGEPRSLKIIKN